MEKFELWALRKNGWGASGKFHLVRPSIVDTLCGKNTDSGQTEYVQRRRSPFGGRSDYGIEDILAGRVYNLSLLCKTCCRRAERLRNPLDRLAEI